MTLDEYIKDLELRIRQFKQYWTYCQQDPKISQYYPNSFEYSGDWDEQFLTFLRGLNE